MTATLLENGRSPDAELVALSRGGNRDAFGRIVRKYQGMVAGVIYSVCGDLHRSEDLAQETFISAWKSLSGMNDPEKLAPWLCQIARRKAVDYQRANLREKNRLNRLFPTSITTDSASPAQEALEKEEREMLWRILSELPQRYRETMVLYYRQGQSTAAVALATGMTEDAVRQRLTRGREMLRDQVAETLERNLIRSAPTSAFAIAVLAALPALAPQAAKAATLGVAAKGSASAGGGVMAWLMPAAGLLIAAWGASKGTREALRLARSARERRFIIAFAILVAICMAALFSTNFYQPKMFRHHYVAGMISLMIAITIVGTLVIFWARRHWNAIRRADSAPADCRHAATYEGIPMPAWACVAVVLSSTGWMINFAWQARDMQGVAILAIAILALTISVLGFWRNKNSDVRRRFTLFFVPVLAIFTLIVRKWRLSTWIQIAYHVPVHPVKSGSIWVTATFFACVEILLIALLGFKKRPLSSQSTSN
jgi:RNA polymerase sigma factor (sigma-70 family)